MTYACSLCLDMPAEEDERLCASCRRYTEPEEDNTERVYVAKLLRQLTDKHKEAERHPSYVAFDAALTALGMPK